MVGSGSGLSRILARGAVSSKGRAFGVGEGNLLGELQVPGGKVPRMRRRAGKEPKVLWEQGRTLGVGEFLVKAKRYTHQGITC